MNKLEESLRVTLSAKVDLRGVTIERGQSLEGPDMSHRTGGPRGVQPGEHFHPGAAIMDVNLKNTQKIDERLGIRSQRKMAARKVAANRGVGHVAPSCHLADTQATRGTKTADQFGEL